MKIIVTITFLLSLATLIVISIAPIFFNGGPAYCFGAALLWLPVVGLAAAGLMAVYLNMESI